MVLTLAISGFGRAEDLPVRIVAANLSSGQHPNYDLGHGQRILQALRPDVILIQEFNVGDNKDATIEKWVDDSFGAEYEQFRETNARIPNGIISRFKIKEAGEEPDPAKLDRDIAWARIDLPNTDKDLWAISVHLHTKFKSRDGEAQAVLALIQKKQIPKDDYMVLGGDFNTDGPNEQCLKTLAAAFKTAAPQPAAQDGKSGTNAKRAKPYDWVLADEDLAKHQVPTEVAGAKFPAGLVFDSSLWSPAELAKLAPVKKDDSQAPQMQHMAVVKDFKIP